MNHRNNTIILDLKIYNKELIHRAVEEYKSISPIAIKEDEQKACIVFNLNQEIPEFIVDEFYNYLIYLHNIGNAGL